MTWLRTRINRRGSLQRPTVVVPPAVAGDVFIGGDLTATPGDYVYADTVVGEWYKDGVPTGNTTLTYSKTLDDLLALISYVEVATNSNFQETFTSNVVGPILEPADGFLRAGGETAGSWAAWTDITHPSYFTRVGVSGDYAYDTKAKGNFLHAYMEEISGANPSICLDCINQPSYDDYLNDVKLTGIEKVHWCCNGGEIVEQTTRGTCLGCGSEDVFTIQFAELSGPLKLEVRAVLFPWYGMPRVLQGLPNPTGASRRWNSYDQFSLMLYYGGAANQVRYLSPTGSDANNGLTAGSPMLTYDAAMASIMATASADLGGSAIRLLAGTYTNFGPTTAPASIVPATRWFSIEPAEGVDLNDINVAFSQAAGIRVKMTRLRVRSVGVNGPRFTELNSDIMQQWQDSCILIGDPDYETSTPQQVYDQLEISGVVGPSYGGYSDGGCWNTDCVIAGWPSSMGGGAHVLDRNCEYATMFDDVLTSHKTVFDVIVRRFAYPDVIPRPHIDVCQFREFAGDLVSPGWRNYFLRNVDCTDECNVTTLFCDTNGKMQELGIRNFQVPASIDTTSPTMALGQGPDDAYFYACPNLKGNSFKWDDIGTFRAATLFRCVNCTYVNTPIIYKSGTSHIYVGMIIGDVPPYNIVDGEPYDGPAPESPLADITGVLRVFDPTQTQNTTFYSEEEVIDAGLDPSLYYISSVLSPTGVSLTTANSSVLNAPQYEFNGLGPDSMPSFLFTQSPAYQKMLGSIPSAMKNHDPFEFYMFVNVADVIGTTRTLLHVGGSGVSTYIGLYAGVSGSNTSFRFVFYDSGGGGQRSISLPASDFSGDVILHWRRTTTGLQLTAYSADYVDGVTTGLITWTNSQTVSGTNMHFGGAYTGNTANAFLGPVGAWAVYTAHTTEVQEEVINTLKNIYGIEW